LNLELPAKSSKTNVRKLVAVALLFSNTLAWFYVLNASLLDLIVRNPRFDLLYTYLGTILFYGFAVSSGIIGSIICERVERRKFLWSWLTFGLLMTFSLVFFEGLEFSLLSVSLLGIAFGLGFPTCQAFLTESTSVEKRGRIAGVVIFTTFTIVITILLAIQILQLGIVEIALICLTLKATSFLALFLDPCERERGATKTWSGVVFSRGFVSYAVPWLIFQLANGITLFGRLSPEVAAVHDMGTVLEFFATIFAALLSGFLADRFGRKQPILIGLIMLGVAYAFFGIVASPESYLLYITVEGAAWGLIAVSYMLTVLGDLSSGSGSKERFYALGGLLIPLLTLTVFSVVQEWSGFSLPANSLSQLLSIVVLLSVIPVFRAPETLPEAKLRARKLMDHIKKVGKLVEKTSEGQ